jgi:hypothetical protein
MIDPSDPLPLGHDGYLKVWALGAPRLPADYILLDEAQDTNPVVLDLLGRQEAQIVYVGDKYQQIYEFRGAVNAMDEAEAAHTAHLTTSFRFGGDIAWAANRALGMLGEKRQLVGNPNRQSRLTTSGDGCGTILARTNATTITACIEALDGGRRPHLVGGTEDLVALLRGVQDLKRGQPSTRPEFFGFENWQQVLEFVRSGEGEDLLTFVNLVETRGEAQLLWALGRVVDEEDADLIISTAHKAKGREWNAVRLTDDFLKSLPAKDEKKQPTAQIDPAELRLLYVALTRGKDLMSVPTPMMEFLKTGVLPASSTPEQSPAQRRQPSPPRQTPTWVQPADWRPSTTPRPTPTTVAPVSTPAASANAKAENRRPGFFKRWFGD